MRNKLLAHLIQGSADAIPLADSSVHCVVTSPPYFNLRDYGVAGQIGLERTPAEYIARMVAIFREVRRVLRSDGLLFLNIGDSYAATGKNRTPEQATRKSTLNGSKQTQGGILTQQNKVVDGLKPKDLIGIPWMLAFALRDDGWYLRSDLIWYKTNPMPSSVKDRCTTAHEYLFMLAKSPRYFFDAEAIAVEAVTAGKPNKMADGWDTGAGGHGSFHREGREKGEHKGDVQRETKNRRSVWSISLNGFKGAHFATFPRKLVEPCIKAGTSERGCCRECGAPIKRVVERVREATRPAKISKTTGDAMTDGNRDPQRHISRVVSETWVSSCKCNAGDPVPCRVFDPFSGAATTAMVARDLGRIGIGLELKSQYNSLAAARLSEPSKPAKDTKPKRIKTFDVEPGLFDSAKGVDK